MSSGATTSSATPGSTTEEMVWIPPATYRMGSNDHYREEAPVHTVTVGGFWIDQAPVTNRRFAQFVDEAGYVTVAERPLDPAEFPGAPSRTSSLARSYSPEHPDRSIFGISASGGHGRPEPAGAILRELAPR
jgi:formylglycine-generating enzyme required for sulfatase activity